METPSPILGNNGLVLVVDDQPLNLELVEEILSDEGYRVVTAEDGAEALAAVARELPDCIVLDIMMPGIDGFEVCTRLKSQRRTRFVPIVMLTALTAVEDKVRSLELGADDFLTKPVIPDELLARVSSLIKIKRLRDELDTSENIVISMVQALENKVPRSFGHAERVALNAAKLAQRLSLNPSEVEVIARAALVHDLGKIGISENLLLPGAPLSENDQNTLRRHPEIGEQILSPLISFARVRSLVRHHHERLDGSGYPDGLGGDELDLTTEILSLANLHDNLCELAEDDAAVHQILRRTASRGEFHRETVEALIQLEQQRAADPEGSATAWQELVPPPTDTRTGSILIGAAASGTRATIEAILDDDGHQVTTVDTGPAVIKAVEELKPDLVMVSARLPDIDGVAVCRNLKQQRNTQFLPVIIVTADREMTRTVGTGAGADDFLSQPINRLELGARVRSLLRLRLYFRDLEEYHNVILSLASALEAKDPYTRGHSERVGILATRVAHELGLADELVSAMQIAGQLHDIGKIGIPEALLNKPAALTSDELVIVRSHASRGEVICRPLRSSQAVLPIIRHHHERFDGSGYPDGLAGEDIPIGARVLGLADAFDALTSSRSYRHNLTPEAALSLLEQETSSGSWDPRVLTALTAVVRRTMQT